MNPAAEPPILRTFAPPSAALRPFVERLWSWESECPVPLPLLLPGTGADLMLHYRTPFLALRADNGDGGAVPAAHLTCLRTHARRLVAPGPVGFVAVRFRTSAIRHLGRLRMDELIDRFPDAAEHFGPEVDELPARLASLPDFAARARCVERFLLGRIGCGAPELAPGDHAVDALYYAEPGATVADVAEDLGYSGRQFERLVGGAAGMPPKRFQRIARLNHTLRQLFLAREPDYLDAALERGYYDQAHFIHETGELTGHTPRELLTPESFLSHFYNPRLPR